MAHRHGPERVGLERQHLLRAGPVALVAGVAAVGRVHRHEHVELAHPPPERIELLEPERAGAIRAGDRGGADEHRLGATLDAPLELLDRKEHTSELQSLMRISYAVFCLKKKKTK